MKSTGFRRLDVGRVASVELESKIVMRKWTFLFYSQWLRLVACASSGCALFASSRAMCASGLWVASVCAVSGEKVVSVGLLNCASMLEQYHDCC
jgi:hypothetical protein